MQGRISSIEIKLTKEQKDILNSWLRRSTTPMGLAKRARAVLMLASGETFHKTSECVGMGERHIRKWARRFIEQGVEGLYDAKRPGRSPVFSPSSGIVFGEDCLRTTGCDGAIAFGRASAEGRASQTLNALTMGLYGVSISIDQSKHSR